MPIWLQIILGAAGLVAVALGVIKFAAARLLADQDRLQVQKLIALAERILVRVDAGAATGLRNEAEGARVADALRLSQAHADAVDGEPGEAADTASRSPDP